MNSKIKFLAIALLGGLLSASALSASVVTDPSSQAGRAGYAAPAPSRIVRPTGIPRRYEGETVRLSLTIDEQGRPHKISLLTERDPRLIRQLLPAVARWKFTPAMQNGRPVAADVVLPLQLVDTPAI
ncbi:MAG: TonB family protein [Oleiharenicola lentus]